MNFGQKVECELEPLCVSTKLKGFLERGASDKESIKFQNSD